MGMWTIASSFTISVGTVTGVDITVDYLAGKDGTDGAAGGDVSGPASAVDENIAVFDGVTGKLIKDGLINKSAITANTAKVSFDSTSSTRLANTSGTNTGDQVGDGVTITGAGTVGDPFVSAGGGGATLEKAITQASHGLIVGDAIKHNGTIWVKAQADSTTNSGTLGVVTEVTDVDNFIYTYGGILTVGTYTNGTPYFLSPSVAGAIIAEPTYIVGEVREFIGTGTPDGLLLEIDLGDEVTKGGGGANSYFLSGWVDSAIVTNWMGINDTDLLNNEYTQNMFLAKTASMVTAPRGNFNNVRPLFVAKGSQTVTGFRLYAWTGNRAGLDNVSIIKTKDTNSSTFNYITVLYEGAISIAAGDTGVIFVADTSFTNTDIADGDAIWVFFSSSTLNDIPITFNLTTE